MSAIALPPIFQYAFAATKVLGAINTLQQSSAQANLYKVQAEQAKLESERKALQYEQRANETLRKVNQSNAAAAARGYAGGILGLEGSPALIARINEKTGGEEFMRDISNAKDAVTFGAVQSSLLTSAAKTASRSGLLSAAMGVGEAGYLYSKIGSAPSTKTKLTAEDFAG